MLEHLVLDWLAFSTIQSMAIGQLRSIDTVLSTHALLAALIQRHALKSESSVRLIASTLLEYHICGWPRSFAAYPGETGHVMRHEFVSTHPLIPKAEDVPVQYCSSRMVC